MKRIALQYGSNVGNTKSNLIRADKLIELKIGSIVKRSSYYSTEPWGGVEQNDFLNQVVIVESELEPMSVLSQIQSIELELGRDRKKELRWGPRLIDIDILYIDKNIVENETLTLPHPRMHKRKFVLLPLSEIDPMWNHPRFNLTISELLINCKDESQVNKLKI